MVFFEENLKSPEQTKEFLRVFHLGSLDELPEMPGIEADGQMRIGVGGVIDLPDEEETAQPQPEDAPTKAETDAESETDENQVTF